MTKARTILGMRGVQFADSDSGTTGPASVRSSGRGGRRASNSLIKTSLNPISLINRQGMLGRFKLNHRSEAHLSLMDPRLEERRVRIAGNFGAHRAKVWSDARTSYLYLWFPHLVKGPPQGALAGDVIKSG